MNHNEKALLVVSYGTAHPQAREETIGAVERELARAFPDRKPYRAWTSDFMRRRVREREALQIDSLREAADRMRRDGITDVLIQPVFVICATEYRKVLDLFGHADAASGSGFDTVRIGKPLLSSGQDLREVAALLPKLAESVPAAAGTALPDSAEGGHPVSAGDDRPDSPEGGRMVSAADAGKTAPAYDRAVVYMGHGSSGDPAANRVYRELRDELIRQGNGHVLIGTLDGTDGIETVIVQLRQMQPSEVLLLPLLITAGSHVIRDMAGERDGSWKSRIRQAGFRVEAVPRGICSYQEIRELFVAHAMAAL